MTLIQFNIDAVLTPTEAKRGISADRDNAKLIRQRIGNPDNLTPAQFDKAVFCALRLDASVEGFASRFVARHYSFLRYWNPIKSWVFHTKNSNGDYEWRPVPEAYVYKLLQHMIKTTDKELRYVHAANDLDIIPARRVNALNGLPYLINSVLSSNPDLNAIFDAARTRLTQNYQVAGEPISAKAVPAKPKMPRDSNAKPLGRPKGSGKKGKAAVLDA